ncbi:helix-turn-helix transcriptional regulator [Paenibacillus cremeus]|nr:helix-turn-helix transcriptional regulator [Paenibacillus cremeus]
MFNHRLFGRKMYRNNFLIVLCITMIPTLFLAVAAYFVGSMQLEKEVTRNHSWQIQQLMGKMDESFNQLESTVSQFSIHPLFGEGLKNINLATDYEYVQNLYQSLMLMKGTNHLINKIIFYSNPHQASITEQGVQSIKDTESEAFFRNLLDREQSFFWSDVPDFYKGKVFPKMLVLKTPVNTSAYGVILILLDSNKVEALYNQSLTSMQDFFLVMENERSIALGGVPANSVHLAASYEKNHSNHPDILSINGEKYSVTYNQMRRLNESWVYMAATPTSRVTNPIKMIAKWIMIVSVSCIFLAITLSWAASLRIYKPIDRLTREKSMIEQKLHNSLPEMRDGFFLQLLNGHLYSLNESELQTKLTQLGWEIQAQSYSVLVVMLSGLPNGQSSFSKGDEQLLGFAATNIVEELIRKRFVQSHVINNQDLTIGVLIAHHLQENTHERMKQELFQFSNEIENTINFILKRHVTVSLGRIIGELKFVPQEMQRARDYLKYRDISKANQILDIENYISTSKISFFPIQIEIDIVQAIHLWKGEEAIQLIHKFGDEMEANSQFKMEILLGMQILLGSIERAVLQAGFHPYNLYKGKNLFDELSQIQDKEEMILWFSETVIQPYIEEVKKTQALKKKQTIDRVLEIIQQEYMNDISLEQCAERVGVLPYALSKAFKQVTGTTFVVYVTRLKIEKCKQLITNSNLMLGEIASELGWHPAYLNKIFKKYEGITPGQFREKYFS